MALRRAMRRAFGHVTSGGRRPDWHVADVCNTVCNVDFDFVKEQPRLLEAPLKTVLCQVRYPAQIGFSEAQVRPIQRRLAGEYPRAEVGQLSEVRLDAVGVTPLGSEHVFHFRDVAASWTVTITRAFLSLETTAYTNFRDFLERWHAILGIVADALDVDRQERIGLRYVNEVPVQGEPTPGVLRTMLRSEVVGIVGAHPATERLLTSMHELRCAEDQGACALRHGLLRQPLSNVYVVDLDLYDEVPGELDVERQAKLLASFNHRAFDLFRWLWLPEQFKKFKPEDPA
jgi:uncharacterized protein (TIGR04255 family)